MTDMELGDSWVDPHRFFMGWIIATREEVIA